MLTHAAPRRMVTVLFVVALVLTIGRITWSNCPECYGDQPPMAGHGPAPDGSGRRVVTIRIDSSWGTPTNEGIWNATNAAIQEWNGARDGNNNSTGYYFILDQTASPSDITIKQGNVDQGVCANTTVHGPPHTTTLPPSTITFSVDEKRGRIAHELAHPLGLDDNFDANCSSIMRNSAADCHRTNNHVLPADVAAVNRNFSTNRDQLCNSASGNVHSDPTPTPTCTYYGEEISSSWIGQCDTGESEIW